MTKKELQELNDEWYAEFNKEMVDMAIHLNISVAQANQIWYLRQRSRWTQELEDRILRANRFGHFIHCGSGEELEHLERLGF